MTGALSADSANKPPWFPGPRFRAKFACKHCKHLKRQCLGYPCQRCMIKNIPCIIPEATDSPSGEGSGIVSRGHDSANHLQNFPEQQQKQNMLCQGKVAAGAAAATIRSPDFQGTEPSQDKYLQSNIGENDQSAYMMPVSRWGQQTARTCSSRARTQAKIHSSSPSSCSIPPFSTPLEQEQNLLEPTVHVPSQHSTLPNPQKQQEQEQEQEQDELDPQNSHQQQNQPTYQHHQQPTSAVPAVGAFVPSAPPARDDISVMAPKAKHPRPSSPSPCWGQDDGRSRKRRQTQANTTPPETAAAQTVAATPKRKRSRLSQKSATASSSADATDYPAASASTASTDTSAAAATTTITVNATTTAPSGSCPSTNDTTAAATASSSQEPDVSVQSTEQDAEGEEDVESWEMRGQTSLPPETMPPTGILDYAMGDIMNIDVNSIDWDGDLCPPPPASADPVSQHVTQDLVSQPQMQHQTPQGPVFNSMVPESHMLEHQPLPAVSLDQRYNLDPSQVDTTASPSLVFTHPGMAYASLNQFNPYSMYSPYASAGTPVLPSHGSKEPQERQAAQSPALSSISEASDETGDASPGQAFQAQAQGLDVSQAQTTQMTQTSPTSSQSTTEASLASTSLSQQQSSASSLDYGSSDADAPSLPPWQLNEGFGVLVPAIGPDFDFGNKPSGAAHHALPLDAVSGGPMPMLPPLQEHLIQSQVYDVEQNPTVSMLPQSPPIGTSAQGNVLASADSHAPTQPDVQPGEQLLMQMHTMELMFQQQQQQQQQQQHQYQQQQQQQQHQQQHPQQHQQQPIPWQSLEYQRKAYQKHLERQSPDWQPVFHAIPKLDQVRRLNDSSEATTEPGADKGQEPMQHQPPVTADGVYRPRSPTAVASAPKQFYQTVPSDETMTYLTHDGHGLWKDADMPFTSPGAATVQIPGFEEGQPVLPSVPEQYWSLGGIVANSSASSTTTPGYTDSMNHSHFQLTLNDFRYTTNRIVAMSASQYSVLPISPNPSPESLVFGNVDFDKNTTPFLERVGVRVRESSKENLKRSETNPTKFPVRRVGDGIDPVAWWTQPIYGALSRRDAECFLTRCFDRALPTYRYLYRSVVQQYLDDFFDKRGQLHGPDCLNRAAVLFVVLAIGELETPLNSTRRSVNNNPPGPDETSESQTWTDSSGKRTSNHGHMVLRAESYLRTSVDRLTKLQARVLLVQYHLLAHRVNAAAEEFKKALEMARYLGYNETSNPHQATHKFDDDVSVAEAEARRRTYWAIYTLDLQLSLIRGKPRLIYDGESVGVEMPLTVKDEYLLANKSYVMPRRNVDMSSETFGYFAHIMICIILARQMHLLYQPVAVGSSQRRDRTTISKKAIEDWLESVTAWKSYQLRNKTLPRDLLNRQAEVLSLTYCQMLIATYRYFVLASCLLNSQQRGGVIVFDQLQDDFERGITQVLRASLTTVRTMYDLDRAHVRIDAFKAYCGFQAGVMLHLCVMSNDVPAGWWNSCLGDAILVRRLVMSNSHEGTMLERYGIILEEMHREFCSDPGLVTSTPRRVLGLTLPPGEASRVRRTRFVDTPVSIKETFDEDSKSVTHAGKTLAGAFVTETPLLSTALCKYTAGGGRGKKEGSPAWRSFLGIVLGDLDTLQLFVSDLELAQCRAPLSTGPVGFGPLPLLPLSSPDGSPKATAGPYESRVDQHQSAAAGPSRATAGPSQATAGPSRAEAGPLQTANASPSNVLPSNAERGFSVPSRQQPLLPPQTKLSRRQQEKLPEQPRQKEKLSRRQQEKQPEQPRQKEKLSRRQQEKQPERPQRQKEKRPKRPPQEPLQEPPQEERLSQRQQEKMPEGLQQPAPNQRPHELEERPSPQEQQQRLQQQIEKRLHMRLERQRQKQHHHHQKQPHQQKQQQQQQQQQQSPQQHHHQPSPLDQQQYQPNQFQHWQQWQESQLQQQLPLPQPQPLPSNWPSQTMTYGDASAPDVAQQMRPGEMLPWSLPGQT